MEDIDEIYCRTEKLKGICNALATVLKWAARVCAVLALFLIVSAVLLALGETPFYLYHIDSSIAESFLNITFPTHTMLPIDTSDTAKLWAVQLGSMGLLISGWAEISFLLMRNFKEISEGKSPFAKKQIASYRIISVCVSAMSVCQPALGFAAVLLWAFSFFFKYAQYTEKETQEMFQTQEAIIIELANLTEQKSAQTGYHVKRVSEYSRILAQKAGLPAAQVETIRIASMLHDIGKVMIDASILEKPGKLTDEEFCTMKQHVNYGEMLLRDAKGKVLQTARLIAHEHHERWDGTGYLHMKGEDISLEGRIVAIADVFDALVSTRSYKEAWSVQTAYDEILSQSGRQFDPHLTELFAECRTEIESAFRQYRE